MVCESRANILPLECCIVCLPGHVPIVAPSRAHRLFLLGRSAISPHADGRCGPSEYADAHCNPKPAFMCVSNHGRSNFPSRPARLQVGSPFVTFWFLQAWCLGAGLEGYRGLDELRVFGSWGARFGDCVPLLQCYAVISSMVFSLCAL